MSTGTLDSALGTFAAPSGARSKSLLAGLLSGAAVVVFDFFIVLACLPSIEQTLRASTADLQLVVAVYAIANGSFLVVGGRLGDVYGRRKLFTIGIAAFALASFACAFATTPTMLIVFRVLQGVGGALIQPQVLGLLSINFDAADRQRVFGLYAASLGAAGIIAQLVGGAMVGLLPLDIGWRACFLVGVPICGLALWFARGAADGRHNPGLKIDVVGAFLLAVALGCMSCFLTIGRDQDWPIWNWYVLGCALVSATAFARWIVVGQDRPSERLLPLGIVKRREVLDALLMVLVFYAGVASFYFVLALELRLTTKLTPFQAGAVFGWLGTCFVVASSSGTLKTWIGARWMLVGMVSLGLGHIILAASIVLAQGQARVLGVLAACGLEGVGLGLLMGPIVALAVSKFRQDDASLGGGMAATTQQIGNSVGVVTIGFAYFGPAGVGDRAIGSGVAYLLATLLLLGILFHRVSETSRHEPQRRVDR